MTNNNPYQPVIVAAEILTALGNLDETWQALMAGISGLHPVSIEEVPNTYPAGRIVALGDEYGSKKRLENLLGIGLTLSPDFQETIHKCDIIAATTKSGVDELFHSPENPGGQPWDLATMIAEKASATGRKQTISAACASGTVALIQAAKHIMAGTSQCVLVVGIDLLSRFVMTGFDALKGLSPSPCRPFDEQRDGLSLGEGIGAILLCSEQFARENNLKICAGLAGWGVSCDATHITAPSRDARGLIKTINRAKRDGAVEVGAINAHGTGTVYNDAMELTAFGKCWDKQPPFHSVKGAIGHCLGAAGVIEAAIALRSLSENCIPPTVGYKEGEASPQAISGTTSLPLQAPTILTCNSGFGGINAGIIFSRP